MNDFEDRRIVTGTLVGETSGGACNARVEVLRRQSTGSLEWSFRQHAAALYWFGRGFHGADLHVRGEGQSKLSLNSRPQFGLIAPGTTVEGSFQTAGTCKYVAIFVNSQPLTNVMKKSSKQFFAFEDRALERHLFAVMREFDRERVLKNFLVEAGAQQLIAQAARRALYEGHQQTNTTFDQPALSLVDEYIDAHLDEVIRLRDLSAITGYSPRHFTRILRLTTGLTPMRYVTGRRLDRAAHLLEDPKTSVTAIAYMTGFGSPQNFSTAFKQRFGMSPRQFTQSRTSPVHSLT